MLKRTALSNTTSSTKDGWHPEDIKAAIRKRGVTLEGLGAMYGYCDRAVGMTIRSRRWPAVEQIISVFLGVPAEDLWPERYQDRDA